MRAKAEIKVENWADHNIRFVWKDGEWWGVLKDICDALGLQPKHVKERLEAEYKCIKGVVSNDLLSKTQDNKAKNTPNKNNRKRIKGVVSNDLSGDKTPELSTALIPTSGGQQELLIANELAIYDAIFMSRKKEAKVFRRWVYNMLRTLRQKSGFEGFEVFRMMDKEQQKEAMRKMRDEIRGTRELTRQDYIKANTIADKAVSNRAGLPTMMHKGDMSPDMLKDRQPILDDVVEIMSFKERFGLDISVSDTVYKKWGSEEDRGE